MELKNYYSKSWDYKTYFDFVFSMTKETTDKYAQYYPINYKRMERLNSTLVIPDQIQNKINQLKPLTYLVLSEGWCGDCAQIIPVLAKMTEVSKNIELKILIAAQNNELLEKYPTNNSLSVPVVIGMDKETNQEKFVWGARPKFGLELLKKYKSDKNYTKDEFQKDLQMAYNKDKGITIMNELIALHYEI
jgi:thiol-disulfide isomerase/thioredoxin